MNEENISMTATETITSNERVLAADPLVEYIPAKDGEEEQKGGIGEEDIVSILLPYIHSAREGVLRLGALLESYGTYEMKELPFRIRMRSGGWRPLAVITGLQGGFRMMLMLLCRISLGLTILTWRMPLANRRSICVLQI